MELNPQYIVRSKQSWHPGILARSALGVALGNVHEVSDITGICFARNIRVTRQPDLATASHSSARDYTTIVAMREGHRLPIGYKCPMRPECKSPVSSVFMRGSKRLHVQHTGLNGEG